MQRPPVNRLFQDFLGVEEMAIRKAPSWDLSLNEINRRAKDAKVNALFRAATPQQVRADSVEIDREALREVVRSMTPAQVMAYSAAHARGENVRVLDFLDDIRADSIRGDGLRMTTTYDQSNRPIHTFESVTGRKDWMNQFKAVPLLMTAMTNNTVNTRKQAQRYLHEHPDAIPL
jgi:hypothetical protein